MKLAAHPVKTGQARRGLPGKVISFYIVPLDPAYLPTGRQGGACGARSGHECFETYSRYQNLYPDLGRFARQGVSALMSCAGD